MLLHKCFSFIMGQNKLASWQAISARYMQNLHRAKDLVHEWNKIVQNLAYTEIWTQKFFQTLPPNFDKRLNKSCHKFHPFCMAWMKLTQMHWSWHFQLRIIFLNMARDVWITLIATHCKGATTLSTNTFSKRAYLWHSAQQPCTNMLSVAVYFLLSWMSSSWVICYRLLFLTGKDFCLFVMPSVNKVLHNWHQKVYFKLLNFYSYLKSIISL